MRDLTMHELDAQLAEQLPARELMQFGSFDFNTAIALNISTINQTNVAAGNIIVGGGLTQVNAAAVEQHATALAGVGG